MLHGCKAAMLQAARLHASLSGWPGGGLGAREGLVLGEGEGGVDVVCEIPLKRPPSPPHAFTPPPFRGEAGQAPGRVDQGRESRQDSIRIDMRDDPKGACSVSQQWHCVVALVSCDGIRVANRLPAQTYVGSAKIFFQCPLKSERCAMAGGPMRKP
jgi:hypothetical protein